MKEYTHLTVSYSIMSLAMNLSPASRKKAPLNDVLEEVFAKQKKLTNEQIREKATELSMTERKVERWLRQRKIQDMPTMLEKFSESW